jgi:hypothetical protein
MRDLERAIERRRRELKPLLTTEEPPDATMLELHLSLLDLRLAWLKAALTA